MTTNFYVFGYFMVHRIRGCEGHFDCHYTTSFVDCHNFSSWVSCLIHRSLLVIETIALYLALALDQTTLLCFLYTIPSSGTYLLETFPNEHHSTQKFGYFLYLLTIILVLGSSQSPRDVNYNILVVNMRGQHELTKNSNNKIRSSNCEINELFNKSLYLIVFIKVLLVLPLIYDQGPQGYQFSWKLVKLVSSMTSKGTSMGK